MNNRPMIRNISLKKDSIGDYSQLVFQCLHCEEALTTNVSMIGKSGSCRKCGAAYILGSELEEKAKAINLRHQSEKKKKEAEFQLAQTKRDIERKKNMKKTL
jgi:DNA-directed RNA polymerase subunit M/transcription elongation factor TFIIS